MNVYFVKKLSHANIDELLETSTDNINFMIGQHDIFEKLSSEKINL